MCVYTPLFLLRGGTFGTAAWNRKSVIGKEVELVAERVMAVTTGLLGLRSKENTIFSPFFSYTVMLGIPPTHREKNLIILLLYTIYMYGVHAAHSYMAKHPAT